jgi:cytochrome c
MMRHVPALIAVGFVLLPACNVVDPPRERQEDAIRLTNGDPARGKAAIGRTSCHTIPGLAGEANVGPPLNRIGRRVYIAGVLLNKPENMIRWLKNPPEVDPKTAMPNVGATDADVRDIACYLYTLR